MYVCFGGLWPWQNRKVTVLCFVRTFPSRSGLAALFPSKTSIRIKTRLFKPPQTFQICGSNQCVIRNRTWKGKKLARPLRGSSVTGHSRTWLWQPVLFALHCLCRNWQPGSPDQVTEATATISWDRAQTLIGTWWTTPLLVVTQRRWKWGTTSLPWLWQNWNLSLNAIFLWAETGTWQSRMISSEAVAGIPKNCCASTWHCVEEVFSILVCCRSYVRHKFSYCHW